MFGPAAADTDHADETRRRLDAMVEESLSESPVRARAEMFMAEDNRANRELQSLLAQDRLARQAGGAAAPSDVDPAAVAWAGQGAAVADGSVPPGAVAQGSGIDPAAGTAAGQPAQQFGASMPLLTRAQFGRAFFPKFANWPVLPANVAEFLEGAYQNYQGRAAQIRGQDIGASEIESREQSRRARAAERIAELIGGQQPKAPITDNVIEEAQAAMARGDYAADAVQLYLAAFGVTIPAALKRESAERASTLEEVTRLLATDPEAGNQALMALAQRELLTKGDEADRNILRAAALSQAPATALRAGEGRGFTPDALLRATQDPLAAIGKVSQMATPEAVLSAVLSIQAFRGQPQAFDQLRRQLRAVVDAAGGFQKLADTKKHGGGRLTPEEIQIIAETLLTQSELEAVRVPE